MSMGSISVLILAAQLAASPGSSDDPRTAIEPTQSELESFRIPGSEASHAIGGDESSPILKATGWGMFAASAADLVTTEWGLSEGLSEGNPVASGRGVRIATHVVGPAAVWWTTERLERSGANRNSPSRCGSPSWRLTAMPRFTTCVRSAPPLAASLSDLPPRPLRLRAFAFVLN